MFRLLMLSAIAGVIVVLALAYALPSHAAVYKCVIDGKTAYQGTPCGEPIDTNTVSVMGGSHIDAASNPVARLQQHNARTITDAFNDMPAMREVRARQERIDRAVVAGRITAGMSESEARLVYGSPYRIERDGICRRLIWRNPDHAARVCVGRVSGVLY